MVVYNSFFYLVCCKKYPKFVVDMDFGDTRYR